MADFYAKGTIKVKNADGHLVPFLPNTDVSCVSGSSGKLLSQTLSEMETSISAAERSGGVEILYEDATPENTQNCFAKTLVACIDQYIEAEPDEWYLTFRTKNCKCAIPFYSDGTSYSVDVDWGDGTSSTVTSSGYASESIHTYAEDGTYEVRLHSSGWSNVMLQSRVSVSEDSWGAFSTYGEARVTDYGSSVDAISIFRSTLKAVNSPIPKFKGTYAGYSETSSAKGLFAYCSSLEYIPEDLFVRNRDIVNFSACFYGCSKLKRLPPKLFAGCSSAVHMNWTCKDCALIKEISPDIFKDCTEVLGLDSFFSGTKVSRIPDGIFRNNTKAIWFSGIFENTDVSYIPPDLFASTSAECFNKAFRGTKVAEIPPGLFNHRGVRFDYCFAYTPITKVPAGLFADCQLEVFWNVFQGCRQLTTIESGIFSNCTRLSAYDYAFYRCSALQSIPEDLFVGASGIQRTPYMFSECTSLASIPEHLFDGQIVNNAPWMDEMFRGCSSLTELPAGLFSSPYTSSSGTAYVNIRRMFMDCTGLTSIPAGFFDGLGSRVTNLSETFYGCSRLAFIPADLFRLNTGIQYFKGTFQYCNLASIPAGLFDTCTKPTTFEKCFANNYRLASIPAGLFDACTRAETFSYCFWNDVAIQSIPDNLFKFNTAVTDFTGCFFDNIVMSGQSDLLIDFELHIGSPNVTAANSFVKKENASRTVYVPTGSATETTFNAVASSLGLTVAGE